MEAVNIEFMTKEEQVTQQIIQHLVLVLDGLEDRPLIQLILHTSIFVPELIGLWIQHVSRNHILTYKKQ